MHLLYVYDMSIISCTTLSPLPYRCIANGLIIFGGMAYFKVLRVDQETEEDGLDFKVCDIITFLIICEFFQFLFCIKEHGGIGYSTDMMVLIYIVFPFFLYISIQNRHCVPHTVLEGAKGENESKIYQKSD